MDLDTLELRMELIRPMMQSMLKMFRTLKVFNPEHLELARPQRLRPLRSHQWLTRLAMMRVLDG